MIHENRCTVDATVNMKPKPRICGFWRSAWDRDARGRWRYYFIAVHRLSVERSPIWHQNERELCDAHEIFMVNSQGEASVNSKENNYVKPLVWSLQRLVIIMNEIKEDGERILKVTKKSGNRGRCRKLSLWNWNLTLDDLQLLIIRYSIHHLISSVVLL